MANEYDVVVVGAGTGGYVAAIRAAQLGLKVAVVETQKALGGTCLIWGCIPTKALLEHAHALKVAQAAKEWGLAGIDGGQVGIDMPAVHARKDKIVTGLTGGIEMLFKKNKIDWIKGTARLTGGKGVEVTLGDGGTQTLTATKELIVATGSAPRSVPGIDGRPQAHHLQRRSDPPAEVPKSIAIMGSGAVGVEFASIFKSYGSEVTIIELLPRLVPGEDEAVSAELERTFKKRGIKVHTGTKVTSAKAGGKGVDLEMHDVGRQDAEARRRHAARGHRPRPGDRRPRRREARPEDGARLRRRRSALPDQRARASRPSATSSPWAARTTSSRTCRRWKASCWPSASPATQVQPINYDHVPRCTYCEPEIGSVGLTEAQAKAHGHDVKVGTFPFRALARARMAGETDGFVKIVAEKKYDEVLGVHIIGPRATELVAEAVLALRLECTVEELVKTIHAHPTMSEAVGEAAHAAHGAAIHI